MSNEESKKVLNKNYVSLNEYNKIKYDLYVKEKEIERLNNIIQYKDNIIQNIINERNYWYNESQKISNNQNINKQYEYDLDNFKQMYIEFTKDKNKEIQNKDNENNKLKEQLKCTKEENTKLKDKEIQNKDKEIKVLKEKNKELKDNIKLLFNYKEGDNIDKNFINILLDMIDILIDINNKDGE